MCSRVGKNCFSLYNTDPEVVKELPSRGWREASRYWFAELTVWKELSEPDIRKGRGPPRLHFRTAVEKSQRA